MAFDDATGEYLVTTIDGTVGACTVENGPTLVCDPDVIDPISMHEVFLCGGALL